MAFFTKITTLEELKQIFSEIFFAKQDKVTKISDGSVMNGVAFGAAKLAQKTLKEIALVETHLLPDAAHGNLLDEVAQLYGISPRFGSSQSSGFVRVVGDIGTTYLSGIHNFRATSGLIFELEQDFTIGPEGFGYAKCRSQLAGTQTNVSPLSINQVTPIPPGHKFTTNEYNFSGGRDIEDDELFRRRIKDGANILATGTLSRLEQIFIKINPNVLRVIHQGVSNQGKVVLAILTQNGIDLTASELNDLIVRGEKYFSLNEYRPFGSQFVGVELIPAAFFPVDISCRVELEPAFNPDEVRKNVQIGLNKYFDVRFWKAEQKVEWDDLLQVVKEAQGIKYVYDQFFFPSVDLEVPKNQFPRVRGFLMLDSVGSVISNGAGTLNPIYYPNIADFSLISTALASI